MRLLVAGLELVRLAFERRGDFKSDYWRWRWETAAGDGAGITPEKKRRAIIDYALWRRRMRGMGR